MFFCSQLFFFLYPGLKKIFGCCIVQSPHVYPVINHNLQICSHCLPKVSSPPSTTSVLCSWLHDFLTAQKKPWMLKKWSGAVPHLHAYACVDQGFPWMGAHGWAGWGAEDQPCWGFAGAGTGGPGGILGRGEVGGPGCWSKSVLLLPWGKSLPSSYVSLTGSGGRTWWRVGLSSGQAQPLCHLHLNWADTDAPAGHLHWVHCSLSVCSHCFALFTGHTGTQC